MNPVVFTVLATITSSVGLYGLVATWRRATAAPEPASILVIHKGTQKSAVVSKEYSHSAVKKIAELAA